MTDLCNENSSPDLFTMIVHLTVKSFLTSEILSLKIGKLKMRMICSTLRKLKVIIRVTPTMKMKTS
ncbi:hypothetical protein V1478_008367 [Vespula squamosa]|uniref:Uncharacterized protein n=1 Tax=Vespula squamosa TaxID=30214 RepID=A0ABD2AT98_VESSQ